MTDNKTYYPTPDALITKMLAKAFKGDREITTVLEPSAGQGHIAERVRDYGRTSYGREDKTVSCIEIDTRFQSILRGKGLKVIDSDFLAYAGTDRFDLIIANPPFDDGAEHLLKAIDIMYSGRIVFLLNAETLKNPFSNTRKLLVRRLEELGAEVEYIQNAFVQAERKTAVEVALVFIEITREVESDLFAGCDDMAGSHETRIEADKDIMSGSSITARVEMFNATLHEGLKTIEGYYRSFPKIGDFIVLTVGEPDRYRSDSGTLTMRVNEAINKFAVSLRKRYWQSVLDLEEVRKRMTQKKIDEFNQLIDDYSYMDFTESNIRQFILGLLGSYEDTMTEAVADVFDTMTTRHSWNPETSKNIHYFDGWATNKAFYCNKKVIIPIRGRTYGNPFIGWQGRWDFHKHDLQTTTDDIDKVMNYFDASSEYLSIADAVEAAFKEGQTRGIESTYFKIDCFLKGTVHLTFRSEDIRRRFNVTACKHKKWLPQDYGKKRYSEMSEKERAVVESFEGKAAYSRSVGKIGFAAKKDTLALPA